MDESYLNLEPAIHPQFDADYTDEKTAVGTGLLACFAWQQHNFLLSLRISPRTSVTSAVELLLSAEETEER